VDVCTPADLERKKENNLAGYKGQFDHNFIQNTTQSVKAEKKSLGFYLTWTITLYIALIFFGIFFSWYTVFVSTHKYYEVVGASMKNTLNAELADNDSKGRIDAVYVNLHDDIKLHDIVVIERNGSDSIIKRVMAQAGDYVSVVSGEYDGQPCFYFYRISAEEMKTLVKADFVDEQAKLVENDGAYKIKNYADWGANRPSFEFNGIKYEQKFYNTFLSGYADGADGYFVSNSGMIYVKVPQNKFFCMGDNRGHSKDSRDDGFYDKSMLVGRVEIFDYNFKEGNRFWLVVKFYFSEIEKFFAR